MTLDIVDGCLAASPDRNLYAFRVATLFFHHLLADLIVRTVAFLSRLHPRSSCSYSARSCIFARLLLHGDSSDFGASGDHLLRDGQCNGDDVAPRRDKLTPVRRSGKDDGQLGRRGRPARSGGVSRAEMPRHVAKRNAGIRGFGVVEEEEEEENKEKNVETEEEKEEDQKLCRC